MKAKIKNYQQALEYLGGKKERPYAHNTRIEFSAGDVVTVKYHGSPVVVFWPDYTVFSSCGWKTSTTKERINWFLPDGFRCYQERSQWYITGKQQSFGFADGITIDSDGNIWNAAPQDESDNIKAQIKAIKGYVTGFINALLAGEVESPSGGDCWYCCLKTSDGMTFGDAAKSDHITSHIEESYYVPSMLTNAHEYKPLSGFAQDAIARIWQGAGSDVSEWQRGIMADDVKSSLTAYIKHQLSIAA